jgi:hypothetical protein
MTSYVAVARRMSLKFRGRKCIKIRLMRTINTQIRCEEMRCLQSDVNEFLFHSFLDQEIFPADRVRRKLDKSQAMSEVIKLTIFEIKINETKALRLIKVRSKLALEVF